jgi:hypothetical protein
MGSTPRFALPYPEGVDANDVPAHMKSLADAVDALKGIAPVQATAPSLPVDGQLWYDSAADLLKRWDAAANGGTGAWVAAGNAAYVGSAGATTAANSGAEESTTSTVYTDLATVGPTVTASIGSSGKALVVVSARMRNDTAGALVYTDVKLAGANTRSASDSTALTYEASNAGDFIRASSTFLLTGLAAGSTDFTLQHRVGAGTGSFAHRQLTVIPL